MIMNDWLSRLYWFMVWLVIKYINIIIASLSYTLYEKLLKVYIMSVIHQIDVHYDLY